jgi:hypothetical protein
MLGCCVGIQQPWRIKIRRRLSVPTNGRLDVLIAIHERRSCMLPLTSSTLRYRAITLSCRVSGVKVAHSMSRESPCARLAIHGSPTAFRTDASQAPATEKKIWCARTDYSRFALTPAGSPCGDQLGLGPSCRTDFLSVGGSNCGRLTIRCHLPYSVYKKFGAPGRIIRASRSPLRGRPAGDQLGLGAKLSNRRPPRSKQHGR